MATLGNYLRASAADTGTVSSAVKTLTDVNATFTAAILAAADAVHVTVTADAIRYRYDGGTPSAAVGHLAAANSEFILLGRSNIQNLKMIRVSTDATVFATTSKMGK